MSMPSLKPWICRSWMTLPLSKRVRPSPLAAAPEPCRVTSGVDWTGCWVRPLMRMPLGLARAGRIEVRVMVVEAVREKLMVAASVAELARTRAARRVPAPLSALLMTAKVEGTMRFSRSRMRGRKRLGLAFAPA